MNPIEICIAFVAAIVSVGTPLVFDAISKFDEKYGSDSITDLFEKNSKKKFFQRILVITSIFIVIYIVIHVVLIHSTFSFDLWVIEILTGLIIILSSILVGIFIHFSFVSITFSRPSRLIKFIIRQNKNSSYRNSEMMECFSDFAVYIVRKKDIKDFQQLIINHYIDILKYYNSNSILPDQIFKEIGYKITREIVNYKGSDPDQYQWLTVSILWNNELQNEIDYNRLWKLILLATEYQKDEMIYIYWTQAFKFIQNDLRLSDPIFGSSSLTKIINHEEIDSVRAKREEFIEFHYYLGTLLLFENRIDCISRIWRYTNSQPPRYPLLPHTIGEILSEYFKACTYFDKDRWENSLRFRFPKVETINSDSVIDYWYRKYFLLLFLRQYTMHYNVNYINPIQIPEPPTEIKDITYHLDKIEMLKHEFSLLLNSEEDKVILEGLKLDFITEEWCQENKKQYPIKLITDYQAKLVSKLQTVKESPDLIPDRIDQFYESSREILEKTFDKYFGEENQIFVTGSTTEYNRKRFLKNHELISDREPFVDESISHGNFDSYQANRFSTIIKVTFSESFLLAISKQYLLNEIDVYPAIKKLGITTNPKDYIIVCFQQAPSYYKSVYNIEGLTDNEYKGVKIYNFNICNPELVADTFFIFKKVHRPIVKFNKTEDIFNSSHYHRELLLENFNLAASIVDLKKDPEILQTYTERFPNDDLKNKVLTMFEVDAEISWKDEAKVIAIRVASANVNRGIPNKLEDIKSFDEI